MSKLLEIKLLEVPLPALKPLGRELAPVVSEAHTVGFFAARKLDKETRAVQVAVSTQYVRDAGAAQAHLNRMRIQHTAANAGAQMTRQTAVANQHLINDISRLSSETVKALMDASLGRNLKALSDAHQVQLAVQADVANGQLSPELAAVAQQLASDATRTTIDHDRKTAQQAVEHTERLTSMVFKSSRVVGAEDDDSENRT